MTVLAPLGIELTKNMSSNNKVLKQPNLLYLASTETLKRLLLVLFFHVSCQLQAVNIDQWLTDHIQVEDGLPDSTVYSIAQDQAGFMWFGTTHGLARYDGYDFRNFQHDGINPNSVTNNNTGNIFIDSKDRLWIGTFGGGLNVLEITSGILTRFPYSSQPTENVISENVQTFFEDPEGIIWIGTATGLYRSDGLNITRHEISADDAPSSQSRIWDIVSDDSGLLWLGTSDGLVQLNPENNEFNLIKLPDEMVIDITTNQFRTLLNDDGRLWIGSASGLFSYHINSNTFEFYANQQEAIKINDIHKTQDDQLFVASMTGLFLFHLKNKEFIDSEDGALWQQFAHADVRAIHESRSGVMWLATRDQGVFKVDVAGGLFHYQNEFSATKKLSKKAKQIWSIESDQQGNVYLGTSDSVFQSESKTDFEQVKINNSSAIPGFIRDMKATEESGVWIAGSAGLYLLPFDSQVAEPVTTPFDLVGIKPAEIFSVETSHQGELWLALYNLGILRWDRVNNEAELLQSYSGGALTDLNISHVFEDSKHNIWVGSNLVGLFQISGVDRVVTLHSHQFNDSGSLISNRIHDIFEDSNGRLWVATARGLSQYLYESATFQNLTKAEGLISNSVSAVREDSTGQLWLSYRFGLSRFSPESNQIKNYLLNNGIRNDGVITRSATIDQNDVIWMGSANGFYTFQPNDVHLNENQYVPKLVVSDIKIDNQTLDPKQLLYANDHITLESDNNLVSLKFSVLEYKSPEQIQYLYRLSGLHDEWLNVSQSRQIDLKDLNPGNYHLEIKAVNNDGRWEDQTHTISLVVKPVWWEQSWVRILFVVGILLALVILHYVRTLKIRRQNLLLEQEVNNRTLELKVLNEQLAVTANTDYLTGLPNRMAFLSAVQGNSSESSVPPLNGCVVLADVDHFKRINDKYGHNAGDEVLIQISFIMSNMVRSEDLIARWGGEEFIFHFANKDAETTAALVERIRNTIETTQIQHEDQLIPVTMTFGICQLNSKMSLDQCIQLADESMYQGKKAGRNQVVVSPSV